MILIYLMASKKLLVNLQIQYNFRYISNVLTQIFTLNQSHINATPLSNLINITCKNAQYFIFILIFICQLKF